MITEVHLRDDMALQGVWIAGSLKRCIGRPKAAALSLSGQNLAASLSSSMLISSKQ